MLEWIICDRLSKYAKKSSQKNPECFPLKISLVHVKLYFLCRKKNLKHLKNLNNLIII